MYITSNYSAELFTKEFLVEANQDRLAAPDRGRPIHRSERGVVVRRPNPVGNRTTGGWRNVCVHGRRDRLYQNGSSNAKPSLTIWGVFRNLAAGWFPRHGKTV